MTESSIAYTGFPCTNIANSTSTLVWQDSTHMRFFAAPSEFSYAYGKIEPYVINTTAYTATVSTDVYHSNSEQSEVYIDEVINSEIPPENSLAIDSTRVKLIGVAYIIDSLGDPQGAMAYNIYNEENGKLACTAVFGFTTQLINDSFLYLSPSQSLMNNEYDVGDMRCTVECTGECAATKVTNAHASSFENKKTVRYTNHSRHSDCTRT